MGTKYLWSPIRMFIIKQYFHRLNGENFENNLFKSWNKKMRLQKGFGNIVKT